MGSQPQPLLIPASPRDVDPDAGAVVPIAVIPIDRPGHRWIGRILGLWRLGSAVDEDGIIINLQKKPFDSSAFLPTLLKWFGPLQRIATRGDQCYIIFSDMQKLAKGQDRGLPLGIEPWVAGRETVRGFLEAILLGSGQDRDNNLLVHARPEWIEPMRELFHCCGIQPRRQDVLSNDMLVVPLEDIKRSGILQEGEMAPVPTCLWDIIKLDDTGNAPQKEYDFLQGTSIEANPTIEVFDLCVPGDEYPVETFAAEGGLVTHNTFFHQTPVVQVGQAFRPGDLLVRSNYTDDKGVTALGLNLNVGFQADGENHEDSTSISESAAKRLTSVHLYEHGLANKPDADWGDLRRWVALFPGTLSRGDLERYDDQGIIKVGEKVQPGDRLVLASQRRTIDKMTATRSAHRLLKDASDVWDDDVEGTVTAVHRGPRGPVVLVKSEHPARVGDKLSNRFGAKGVISKIYPDDEMPKDAEGKPLDILINSQSLITRINNTQIMEMALGKLARKLGGVENLPSFGKSGGIREAIARLKQANIKAFEDVAWPSGQKTPALVGPQFIMKLMFETAEKASGRGIAGGYDFLGVPTKGGDAPSKRFGRGQLEANLALSAPLVARDAVIYKGMDIPKYWTDYQLGYRPAPPPAGMAGEAYIARLRAAGIRVQRDGPRYNFLAMSDSDPTLQGAHAIASGETVDWEDRTPRPGGLFDPAVFGPDGTQFGKLRLHKPLPHPIMEEPIRRTLGLTEAKFRSILSGAEELNGKKGPEAIAAALGAIDLDERLKGLYQQIKSTKGATRDAAIRSYQFLKSAKANDRHPKDWILSAAPILPPRYRPISASTGSDMPLVEDSNYLYKELFDANKAWADLDAQTGDTPEETLAAYDAFKAVVGIGDPIQEETRNKGIGGILKPIFGSPSPKWNWLQQKLVGTKENMVGSGVVAPDADLDMDTVGVPEAQAWPMFRVDTLRSMVRGGMPLLRANEEIDNRSESARRHLLKVMDDAVVSFTRYPVLHAYGSPAQRPVLIDGTTIRVNPFVIKGMNMDYDGDTAKVSVIHSKDAKEEALAKMLPSRMLKSMATREVHQVPGVEYGTGLYQLTTDRDPRKPVLRGLTPKQIVQMWKREEISHDQEVDN